MKNKGEASNLLGYRVFIIIIMEWPIKEVCILSCTNPSVMNYEIYFAAELARLPLNTEYFSSSRLNCTAQQFRLYNQGSDRLHFFYFSFQVI